jgi:hypothetical protein
VKQPFLINGIDDVESAKISAFGAAATYLFTFLISIIYVIVEGGKIETNAKGNITNNTRNQYTDSFRRGEYSGIAMTEQYQDPTDNFDNRLVQSDDPFHDDPLWENPLPTARPYRDDPTFT